jgi:hypothetical protein
MSFADCLLYLQDPSDVFATRQKGTKICFFQIHSSSQNYLNNLNHQIPKIIFQQTAHFKIKKTFFKN